VLINLPIAAGAKPGVCGKLENWLYGFRPAAQAWESQYAKKLESIGFVRGRASPVSFYDAVSDVSCLVHGDDFTFVGGQDGLDFVEKNTKEGCELKVKARQGDDSQDDKETDILGWMFRSTAEGVEYEVDPRHPRKVLEVLGCSEKTKGLSVNGRAETIVEELIELQVAEGTSFRALAARLK
jgi:hypothetical protein